MQYGAARFVYDAGLQHARGVFHFLCAAGPGQRRLQIAPALFVVVPRRIAGGLQHDAGGVGHHHLRSVRISAAHHDLVALLCHARKSLGRTLSRIHPRIAGALRRAGHQALLRGFARRPALALPGVGYVPVGVGQFDCDALLCDDLRGGDFAAPVGGAREADLSAGPGAAGNGAPV